MQSLQEYTAPRAPLGARTPAKRSKASFRSHLVDLSTNAIVATESHLETKWVYIFQMRPDVETVIGQSPTIEYVDELGKLRRYTFDILVTFKNGTRVAYAVKPLAKALRQNLGVRMKWIAQFISRDIVDAVAILTEVGAEGWRFSNAKLLHSARREKMVDAAAMEAVGKAATQPTTIGAIVHTTGLAARAFRAVVALIALGDLSLTSEGLITYASTVEPSPPAALRGAR